MISKENLEKSVRYEGFYRKGQSQYLSSAVWQGNFFSDILSIVPPPAVKPTTQVAYYAEGDPYFEPQFVFVGDPRKRGFV